MSQIQTDYQNNPRAAGPIAVSASIPVRGSAATALDRVARLVSQLRSIRSALLGEQPEQVPPTGSPSSQALPALDLTLTRIHGELDDVESIISSIQERI